MSSAALGLVLVATGIAGAAFCIMGLVRSKKSFPKQRREFFENTRWEE